MFWFLYLIECVDDSVYMGIMIDVVVCFDEYVFGKGVCYMCLCKLCVVFVLFLLFDWLSVLCVEYWVKWFMFVKKCELVVGLCMLELVLLVVVVFDECGDMVGMKVMVCWWKNELMENIGDVVKVVVME